jgi:hypothetical protein
VTNNNGLWIVWLNLLTPSLQSLVIINNYNNSAIALQPNLLTFICLRSGLVYDWLLIHDWTELTIESESHCDWRSVRLSVLVSSSIRGSWPDMSYCLTVTVFSFEGAPSLTRGWVCLLSESVSSNKSIVSKYSYIHFTCCTWYDTHIKYIQVLCQSGLSTADYALFIVVCSLGSDDDTENICCLAMDICEPHRKHLLRHRFCCIYSSVT